MKTPSFSQREAITHVNGPAILFAGPGSGKTFTIVSRINYLIQKEHIPPENILVVTFSKAAAKEMQNRFYLESENHEVHFGTFHSLAFFILRSSFDFSSNSLITNIEKRNILSNILKNHGFYNSCDSDFVSLILDNISRQKNSESYKEITMISEPEEITKEELKDIISEFQEFLRENGKIDFDDMILLCLEKLLKNKKVLNKYQTLFKYIMVDEFQDINKPQYDLLRLLGMPSNNIFTVGDDDQAIYRFRGSKPGIMKNFEEDFKDCRKLFLTENYRTGANIVDFSSNIITQNKERIEKSFNPVNNGGTIRYFHFQTRKEEEKRIVEILNSLNSEQQKKTALILRTNREVSLYSAVLKNADLEICEKRNNRNLMDNFVVKDIVCFLNFIYRGRKREDFITIMNKPQKYIQRKALLYETVELRRLNEFYQKNTQMQKVISEFWRKLELCSGFDEKMAVSIIRKSVGYEKYLMETCKSKEEFSEKKELLDYIENCFAKYQGEQDYYTFLNNCAEELKAEERAEEKEGIYVMTMHMSKGLEFDNVILPDINDGIIPPKKCDAEGIEEERRLLYVSVTRARNNLYILSTSERNRPLSRFVKGLVEKYEIR